VPLSLRYLLRGQFKHFTSQGVEVVAVSSDGPEIPAFLEEEGVPHHIIPLSRKITPVQDLKCVWQLYRLLKREKPDVVHSHTPKAGLIAMISAFLAGIPVRMHTVAGLPLMETTGSKRRLLVFVEKLTYRLATHVYPNSFALRDYISNNFYSNSGKLKVIANGSSNGIDIDHFSHTEDLASQAKEIRLNAGIGQDEKVAIFVGRITGDKGINELIKAKNRVEGLKLFLIGPMEPELDPLEASTQEQIENDSDIFWFGFQADVRPYLMAADFLVFPSYREGFPNVPLQAGALGLPCIVTDINGCNEIIIHEKNGLIIPPKDEEALAAAISVMLNSEELFSSMKEEARPMVVNRYDRRVVWKALEQEYENLTKRDV